MTNTQMAAGPEELVRRPTHEEIAERAQELYVRRGGLPGSDREDWLEAERELVEAPRWLDEMTRAQSAHAVHWEHP
jgi:hypothetical protein